MSKKEFREELLERFKSQLQIAVVEGYWFASLKHDLWYSPRQFVKLIKSGGFTHNPDDFQLRKPEEQIDYLTNQTNEVINHLGRVAKYIIREMKNDQPFEVEPHGEGDEI